jgi:hypothetical protein
MLSNQRRELPGIAGVSLALTRKTERAGGGPHSLRPPHENYNRTTCGRFLGVVSGESIATTGCFWPDPGARTEALGAVAPVLA